MNSIRKVVAVGTSAVALCAVAVFALAPVTVLADGPHHWELWRDFARSAKSTTPTSVTLSAPCSAAINAVKAAHIQDRAEDAQERLAAAQAGANSTADVAEDKSERAAVKALWVAARDACAPQLTTKTAPTAPTAACLAAKEAIKEAWARKDFAALRSLWTTVKAACGFPPGGEFAFEQR